MSSVNRLAVRYSMADKNESNLKTSFDPISSNASKRLKSQCVSLGFEIEDRKRLANLLCKDCPHKYK